MAIPVRLAGRGRWIVDLSGDDRTSMRLVTWSVAEGRRGRRSRSITEPGALGVLVETGLDGRLARLEVSSPAGLLTLHPDASREVLHGNVVTESGVRHVRLAWSSAHELVVPACPLILAGVVSHLAREVAVGGTAVRSVLMISDALEIDTGRWSFHRTGPRAWSAAAQPPRTLVQAIDLDEQGVAVLGPPGGGGDRPATWPLEET